MRRLPALSYLLLTVHVHAQEVPACAAGQESYHADFDDTAHLQVQLQMSLRTVQNESMNISHNTTNSIQAKTKTKTAPSRAEHDKVRAILKHWDADSDGSMSLPELPNLLLDLGVQADDAKLLFDKADVKKGGKANLTGGNRVGVLPNHKEGIVDQKKEEEEVKETVNYVLYGFFLGEHGGLNERSLAHYVVVPISITALASMFLTSWIEDRASWVPESLITVFLGMVLGLVIFAKIGSIGQNALINSDAFNETMYALLMIVLLPVLMFDAGWSLRKRDFASQFEYVLGYAVIGSFISFFAVGFLILWTGRMGLHSIATARTAFTYASLVCATDPISTLATFARRKVDPLLNILTFGDSVLNDAVAIILFSVMNDDRIWGATGQTRTSVEIVPKIVLGMIKIFAGSVAIGLFIACAFLIGLRIFDMHHHPRMAILCLTFVAYATFAAAEMSGMSGIIATVFCSIILGIYARAHLSADGLLLSNFFIKQLANVMDTGVFILVGFCVIHWGSDDWGGWIFAFWAMLFCLIGRFLNVIPVTYGSNFLKRKKGEAAGAPEKDWHLISPGIMYMMWHASLRGGIALVLSLEIGDWANELNGPGTRTVLQTGTYLMIVVFLFIFGSTTEIALNYFRIPMGSKSNPSRLYERELPGTLRTTFDFMDKNIMVPLFVGEKKMEEHIMFLQELDKEREVEDALQQVEEYIFCTSPDFRSPSLSRGSS